MVLYSRRVVQDWFILSCEMEKIHADGYFPFLSFFFCFHPVGAGREEQGKDFLVSLKIYRIFWKRSWVHFLSQHMKLQFRQQVGISLQCNRTKMLASCITAIDFVTWLTDTWLGPYLCCWIYCLKVQNHQSGMDSLSSVWWSTTGIRNHSCAVLCCCYCWWSCCWA